MYSLTLTERKLLHSMDFHARDTLSSLSKRIGISKQAVDTRIRHLLKKGIIKGFYPVINVPKLGYLYCRVMLTLQRVDRKERDAILAFLTDHPKVFWMFRMQGLVDIAAVIWASNVRGFQDFIEEIEERFGEKIKSRMETVTTDVIHYQHRYLLGKRTTEEIHIKETEERLTIDELDTRILAQLCEDARMKITDVARRVKASAKVVAYRIRRMEKEKLIEGYRPNIDHLKLGYGYYKLLINLNEYARIPELKEYLKQTPVVIYIVEGVGLPGDLDIEIMVKSNQELFDFVDNLKLRFPELIGEYQTVVFMEILKVRYLPPSI